MTSDVIVIGGGPGGVAAALTAAQKGARVALIERAGLGGVCVHAGCVPSGAYHHTVRILHEVSRAASVGVLTGPVTVDWTRMHEWASGVVNEAARITHLALEHAGVEILSANARFVGNRRLAAADRTFEGAPVIVATGAASVAPVLPGAPSCPVLCNEEAMALSRSPGMLVVLGSGRFSVEWADFFSRLGSQVTVVAPEERILPEEDPELAGFLQILLEERGVKFVLGAIVGEVDGDIVTAGNAKIRADAILSADTRVPNVAGLGLEHAGVDRGEHGGIVVDSYCRTIVPHILAAGDVTGPPWLSNRARAQGTAAATNVLGGHMKVRPERLPRSVNTLPELAAVGFTADEMVGRGIPATVGFGELATSLRGITLGADRGALKLVVDPESGEIFGAHMVGMGAGEVIAQIATAIELEADYRELSKVYHLHPSLAELVSDAVASI